MLYATEWDTCLSLDHISFSFYFILLRKINSSDGLWYFTLDTMTIGAFSDWKYFQNETQSFLYAKGKGSGHFLSQLPSSGCQQVGNGEALFSSAPWSWIKKLCLPGMFSVIIQKMGFWFLNMQMVWQRIFCGPLINFAAEDLMLWQTTKVLGINNEKILHDLLVTGLLDKPMPKMLICSLKVRAAVCNL